MKNVIIGTAGHVDHGKTSLIKALTGRDTDTLKDEIERGISINIGFTFFDLPSGKRAGIIDVPGHERFIKNMLAGVSGVDIVLLVVAADEGIMPQTREHIEILQLLEIKKVIVVLTKIDLVQEEWLSLVKEDITQEFQGTYFEGAAICVVSSRTGRGIQELSKAIDDATSEVKGKDTEGNFRLPVDRVFTAPGFGTIVTGTIISGRIREGEVVEIYPSEIITKIKGIQVHEVAVQFAEAGQRCALNISNVKVQDIKRGFVISKEDVVEPSLLVDCYLYYLKSAQKPLINRQRVKLYHGTEEILCRVIILDKEEVKPGETAYVQLRLEKPVTAQKNDKYVIRSYSPMSTIGGGTIINPRAKKIKAFDIEYINELKLKENGSIENVIENIVEKLSLDFPSEFDIIKGLGRTEEKVTEILQTLISGRRVIKLTASDRSLYIHVNYLRSKIEEIENLLEKYHRENPLKLGMSKEELKSRVFTKSIKQKTFDELLFLLQQRNIIKIVNNFIALFSFLIVYTEEQQQFIQLFKKEYKDAMLGASKLEELFEMGKNKKMLKSVFEHLLDSGELIKVTEDCFMLSDYYERAKQIIISYLKSKQSISVAEGRDILQTNRKHSVALLEHFDAIRLTKRMEDKRVLY